MQYKITPTKLRDKKISELTFEEMAYVHLNLGSTPIEVKNAILRSTLSFISQNIQHSLSYEYSKQLIPYLSLCAVLEQLGICYNRKDKDATKYTNGIKRCLVYFGEIEEDDEFINVIYALRNGLLHNVSLISRDQSNGNKHYAFRFSEEIDQLYKAADLKWDGKYETIDQDREKYTTLLNIKKFRDLVKDCVFKANELNQNSLLELRLEGGLRQFFYDYMQSIDKD